MKLGFRELGTIPSCPACGEHYSNVNDLSIDHYDISRLKPLHVCDPKKVALQKLELKEVVKETIKKQQQILKMKEINEDQLRKSMDI